MTEDDNARFTGGRKSLILLLIHAAAWFPYLVNAGVNAGPHGFIRCWQLPLFFLPPLGLAVLTIAVLSLALVARGLLHPVKRASWSFVLACHATLVLCALVAGSFIAHWVAGPASCL
ncbi:MAG: hypothetical protein RLZZ444_1469 [Pseudomonadota bacterium]